jgi:formylmethanofuran dehydrogenase subunit E
MEFNAYINAEVIFKRLDTGKMVSVNYDSSSVKGNPKMQELMEKLMQGIASTEEKKEFGQLWQSRVEAIFQHADDVITVTEL